MFKLLTHTVVSSVSVFQVGRLKCFLHLWKDGFNSNPGNPMQVNFRSDGSYFGYHLSLKDGVTCNSVFELACSSLSVPIRVDISQVNQLKALAFKKSGNGLVSVGVANLHDHVAKDFISVHKGKQPVLQRIVTFIRRMGKLYPDKFDFSRFTPLAMEILAARIIDRFVLASGTEAFLRCDDESTHSILLGAMNSPLVFFVHADSNSPAKRIESPCPLRELRDVKLSTQGVLGEDGVQMTLTFVYRQVLTAGELTSHYGIVNPQLVLNGDDQVEGVVSVGVSAQSDVPLAGGVEIGEQEFVIKEQGGRRFLVLGGATTTSSDVGVHIKNVYGATQEAFSTDPGPMMRLEDGHLTRLSQAAGFVSSLEYPLGSDVCTQLDGLAQSLGSGGDALFLSTLSSFLGDSLDSDELVRQLIDLQSGTETFDLSKLLWSLKMKDLEEVVMAAYDEINFSGGSVDIDDESRGNIDQLVVRAHRAVHSKINDEVVGPEGGVIPWSSALPDLNQAYHQLIAEHRSLAPFTLHSSASKVYLRSNESFGFGGLSVGGDIDC